MYGTCISITFLCQTNSWFFIFKTVNSVVVLTRAWCSYVECSVQHNIDVDICVPHIVWICSAFNCGTWQRCPVTVLVICKCWTIVFVIGWHGCAIFQHDYYFLTRCRKKLCPVGSHEVAHEKLLKFIKVKVCFLSQHHLHSVVIVCLNVELCNNCVVTFSCRVSCSGWHWVVDGLDTVK